jgi:hypothetical protein
MLKASTTACAAVVFLGFCSPVMVQNASGDHNPMHVKRACGLGLRAGSDDHLYLRFDVAYGDDGTRVCLKFTPAF